MLEGNATADVLAWTLQNRVGFVLAIAGIVAVLFERWGWTHNGILPSVLIAAGGVAFERSASRAGRGDIPRRAG